MNHPDTKKELPEPWYWTDQNLNEQLASEIGEQHVLYNKKVKTLARREDNDDVLFQIPGSDNEFAIVHLTWSKEKDLTGRWPYTVLFKDWTDLFNNGLLDHEEYE